MKKMQGFLLFLALMLMGYSSTLRAEDTDIYVDNATTAGVPNVLFVMDNGANFSANAKIGCNFYTGTTEVPSLGNSTGAGIEQCALVDAIKSLPDNALNFGILVSNANGFANDVRSPTDAAYHEICATDTGGCLIRKLTLMTPANKANLIAFIKSWTSSGQNSATQFNIKVNTATPATMMQEAWAYFRGKVGMSGKDYVDSIMAGCQKNFIIYIANGEKAPAAEGSPSPFDGSNALTSAQVGATADQRKKISETVVFNPPANTCGKPSIAPGTQASDWSENWADEWSRLMFQQDGGAATAEGAQNIITYTVAVLNEDTCTPDYPALMTTMATHGGGKFFKTGSAVEITKALAAILNEVQAVNSVFSSASLPVSVNAEGSYLNQIYLGMFRPDAGANPRWLGNLKQYALVKVAGNLVMGDAGGNSAISSSGTGFISPNAVSFWTTDQEKARAPDNAGGFFKNEPKGEPKSGYDKPDGEVVEKGGVAQQLRLENLTADFGAPAGSASNPRRLYTYCPHGGSCVASLLDSSNEFSTANLGIGAAAFGSTTTVPITSIVRSGTSAVVTTNGNHGFVNGTSVTVSNSSQTEYNVTQAVTANSSTTFTITGLPDYPTTPSQGAYTVASVGVSPVSITSMVRGTSTTGAKNSETVTVYTSAPHGFTSTSTVAISGATPSVYNFSGVPSSVGTSSFTFSMAIEPSTATLNTYKMSLDATAYPTLTSVALTNPAEGEISGTKAAHGLSVGQTVVISGSAVNKYNGTFTIATVGGGGSTFTITGAGASVKNLAGANATVAQDTATQLTLSGLTRAATTVSATATASVTTANFFGSVVGDTKKVTITKTAGTQTNQAAYAGSYTITCTNAGCTTFTYPITITPTDTATPALSGGTMTAGLAGSASVNVAAGAITRSGTTATVSGIPPGTFANGQSVTISAVGAGLSTESAYIGTWPVTCPAVAGSPCVGTTISFGTVTLSPTTPATGVNMQAFSGTTPPDKDTVVKWLRGADNYGDEKGPLGTVTVRPSIHGDVLHSRPLVINYGDSRGIVVFYGSNDGVFRAVNGNQAAAIGSVPAGGELWGLVAPEHFGEVNRLRLNSPELRFPGTTLATAQPKDYFVDGPTGTHQTLNADGTINKAYIYLTMRRGGRFIYALDVTTPTAPIVKWRIDSATPDFEELGQTWSRPRLTVLQSSALTTTPVLVFGGGYDPAEDSEPPATNSMGRGIFVVNAETGALIWSATGSCTTSAKCLNVAGMTHAVPSDIAFVDRDSNGYTDKMYFGDVGGNIWRADVSAAATTAWTVTKLAALGCATGTCASGVTPRKFFFPPSVLTVKSGAGAYEAISAASGDREHPLKSTATGSSYNTNDRFFMLMDRGTTVGGTGTTSITPATLFNSTSTVYNGSLDGFFISFTTGEKAVNAPLAVQGNIYFATNKPIDRKATCSPNLGEAKAYAVSPFTGTKFTNILAGGGLPPSAVTGLITYTETKNGVTTHSEEKFCIGCGVSVNVKAPGRPCVSALDNCPPGATVPKNMRRTYWYKK